MYCSSSNENLNYVILASWSTGRQQEKLLMEAGKAPICVGKTWEAEHTCAKLRGAEKAMGANC